jgi:hypothetical protein
MIHRPYVRSLVFGFIRFILFRLYLFRFFFMVCSSCVPFSVSWRVARPFTGTSEPFIGQEKCGAKSWNGEGM